MVPVPLFVAEQVVITKNLLLEVKDFSSLKPYRVGIRKGIKSLEKNTIGLNVDISYSSEILLKKIDTGRVDVGILDRAVYRVALQKSGLTELTVLEPPIMVIPVYHYLHSSTDNPIPGGNVMTLLPIGICHRNHSAPLPHYLLQIAR